MAIDLFYIWMYLSIWPPVSISYILMDPVKGLLKIIREWNLHFLLFDGILNPGLQDLHWCQILGDYVPSLR